MVAVNFSFKTSEETNFINVFLEGPINESFASFDLQVNRDKSIRFEFSKVSSINSIGIRFWISWLHRNPGIVYHFKNCPVCIVEQINNVRDFMPLGTTIESFFVPYYSEFTGEEKHELYVQKTDFQQGKSPLIKPITDSEGNSMEVDIYPQKYFKFLSL